MLTKKPLVSIVMPVYNAGSFLCQSLDSILKQSFKDWELICVNDASNDNSQIILNSYKKKDRRIKVFRIPINQGVSYAANAAISESKGQFIARMDADDIMYPGRLQKQLNFLHKNQDIVAIGGQCLLINKNGKTIGTKTFPREDEEIKKMIFYSIPVQQPSIMVNKKLLPYDFVWYKDNSDTAEEVDLLFRLFQIGRVANLKDFILKYRIHGKNTSLLNPKKTFNITYKTRLRAISLYGYKPTAKARLINNLEFIAVKLIPNQAVYPIYSILRGLKEIKVFIITFKLNPYSLKPKLAKAVANIMSL